LCNVVVYGLTSPRNKCLSCTWTAERTQYTKGLMPHVSYWKKGAFQSGLPLLSDNRTSGYRLRPYAPFWTFFTCFFPSHEHYSCKLQIDIFNKIGKTPPGVPTPNFYWSPTPPSSRGTVCKISCRYLKKLACSKRQKSRTYTKQTYNNTRCRFSAQTRNIAL